LAIDDKFEHDIDSLIEVGKEKGYLTYGDVNDMLPEEIGSADDLDDLITTIGTQGIDLLDGPKFGADKDFELEEGEDVELDLTPGTLEKPTTRSACICAKWAPFPCSPAKAKWRSPSALSAASSAS
jgi:RNA polymerase primary sigma factor